MVASIAVKHNIEVAHRLFELPGKCEQIHGHSMWVTMHLNGDVNSKGVLAGIEYGDLKKMFRGHLDETYDHRLLLNASDPFAHPLMTLSAIQELAEANTYQAVNVDQLYLPGLQACAGDPTTENIARWVADQMCTNLEEMLGSEDIKNVHTIWVEVWETSVNMASYGRHL